MEKVLQKWLDQQCRLIRGSRRALLVTGRRRRGTFKRALFWPDENYDYAVFYRVAQVALRNKKTVIKTLRNQGKNSDQSLNVLASPIFVKKKLLGAIVIAMAYRSLSLQNAAVQQVRSGVKWLETMLELPYGPLQTAKTKLFGLRRPSLQTAAGLTVILIVGLILISPLLRIPSNAETKHVASRTIATPHKIDSAKGQPRLSIAPDMENTIKVTDGQGLKPMDDGQYNPKSAVSSESQQVPAAASIEPVPDNPVTTIAPAGADIDASEGLDTDIEKTATEMVAKTHSVEIGPINKASQLKQATQILVTNGFEYNQISGTGSVKAIRLLEGLYTRSTVKERFKSVQKVVGTAFIVKEKDKRAIYVATYYDPSRAEQKIKQLAQKNIHVTAVDAELKTEGPILIIQNCTQPNVDIITDKMSEIGLSVQLSKSE